MKMKYEYDDYQKAAAVIKKRFAAGIDLGLVLGSGLGSLADDVENPVTFSFADIPGWPLSTVSGHSGRLVIGRLGGKNVLVQQGRVHYYEGYSPEEITFPIRVMQALGIKNLIVTNAAGGVNKGFRAGDIMLINDHISFVAMTGLNPLVGPNDDRLGKRFPDMSQAYDRIYCELARQSAKKLGIPIQEGVYAWLSGPNYESPAEVRFLRSGGVDAVGMSTVPEVIVARHAGMRVLGFSGITNQCSDDGEAQSDHKDVLEAANTIGPKIVAILKDILPEF